MEKEFLSCSEYLEAGEYRLVFSSSSLAIFKLNGLSTLPPTLEETLKGFWEKPAFVSESLYKRFIEKIWRIIEFIRYKVVKGPRYLEVQNFKKQTEKFTRAQIATVRPNGKVVLFDSNNQLVSTRYVKTKKDNNLRYFNPIELSSYQELRNKLGDYFSIPQDYGFSDNFHCQEMINGKGFAKSKTVERISIIKNICNSCSRSIFQELPSSQESSYDLLKKGFLLSEGNISNQILAKFIDSRKRTLLERSKDWKMIPSHYDLTAHNLTILNNTPFLLDLAPHKLGLLPVFLMPICLIHSELKEYQRDDLALALWAGEFDNEFKDLFSTKIMNNEIRNDLFLAESLTLLAVGSKINTNSIEFWFQPILEKINLN
jgi:hypothetical protein